MRPSWVSWVDPKSEGSTGSVPVNSISFLNVTLMNTSKERLRGPWGTPSAGRGPRKQPNGSHSLRSHGGFWDVALNPGQHGNTVTYCLAGPRLIQGLRRVTHVPFRHRADLRAMPRTWIWGEPCDWAHHCSSVHFPPPQHLLGQDGRTWPSPAQGSGAT